MAQYLEHAATRGAGAKTSQSAAEDENFGGGSKGTNEGAQFEYENSADEDRFDGENCVYLAEANEKYGFRVCYN